METANVQQLFRNGGMGRREANGSHFEEYVFQRRGFFIEDRLVFILREKGNSSDKVTDG